MFGAGQDLSVWRFRVCGFRGDLASVEGQRTWFGGARFGSLAFLGLATRSNLSQGYHQACTFRVVPLDPFKGA